MLSHHSGLAWLSALASRYPDRLALNGALMRAVDHPLLEKLLRRKYPPDESYEFWEHYAPGFAEPCRDLLDSDLSRKVQEHLQVAFRRIVKPPRDRLLLKITGWPRLRYLSALFDRPKYIHIVRDGRAVVNSLLHVNFWRGWRGPWNWRWGPLSPQYEAEWEGYNRSFVVLAAIQWKILMDAAEEATHAVGADNVLEIRYEDLCADPIAEHQRAAEFAGLKWSAGFQSELTFYRLRNKNSKWQTDLTAQQRSALEDVLGPYLERFGYS